MAYDPIYLRGPADYQRMLMDRGGARSAGMSYEQALRGLRGDIREREAEQARYLAEQDLIALAKEEELMMGKRVGSGLGKAAGALVSAYQMSNNPDDPFRQMEEDRRLREEDRRLREEQAASASLAEQGWLEQRLREAMV